MNEDLGVWFGTKKKPKGSSQPKGPWVNICRKKEGGGHPPCGRPDASDKSYPKCRAAGVAAHMTDAQKKAACQQKRKAEKYIIDACYKIENFNPIIFRKGTISGISERMRLDLIINTMVSNALRFGKIDLFGGGENWRPILSLQNAVSAYTKVLVSTDEEFIKENFNKQGGLFQR